MIKLGKDADRDSSLCLGPAGGAYGLDWGPTTGNSEVIRAKLKIMDAIEFDGEIEDIRISLVSQYRLIVPVENTSLQCIHVTLTRDLASLRLARNRLAAKAKEPSS